MSDKRAQNLLLTAWIISVLATGGSLFFSAVLGEVPCTLCWLQRLLMYPLVLILGFAWIRGKRTGRRLALPMAAAGFLLACYHYLIQMYPASAAVRLCAPDNPCTQKSFALFGFITIPLLSAAAFLLIALSLILVRPTVPQQKKRRPGGTSSFGD
ncbi:MAG: disulfide oxidoreductase [Sporolactobacillus sp.]|jgi:disulfide bond formation protein DsbB|nr:disulfide oxidoreductase [Sporolactobacillus sp.]